MYKCSNGFLTIGYGTNLETLQIPEHIAAQLLMLVYDKAKDDCAKAFPFYDGLSEARRGVLVSMVYQIGLAGVRAFKRFLEALEAGEYERAAAEMLDSKWAKKDSPARAKRMSDRMKNNTW